MVATGFLTRTVNNPYAHPTTLAVARAMASPDSYINSNIPPLNMACRSQLRNGSIKACRRRGGRSKFGYGSHQNRTVDGSRPFSQFRNCKICKVKQYNTNKSESQKKKIPHRGHHPLCPEKSGQCWVRSRHLLNEPMPQIFDQATLQLSVYPSRIRQIKVVAPKLSVRSFFLVLAQGKQQHLHKL